MPIVSKHERFTSVLEDLVDEGQDAILGEALIIFLLEEIELNSQGIAFSFIPTVEIDEEARTLRFIAYNLVTRLPVFSVTQTPVEFTPESLKASGLNAHLNALALTDYFTKSNLLKVSRVLALITVNDLTIHELPAVTHEMTDDYLSFSIYGPTEEIRFEVNLALMCDENQRKLVHNYLTPVEFN